MPPVFCLQRIKKPRLLMFMSGELAGWVNRMVLSCNPRSASSCSHSGLFTRFVAGSHFRCVGSPSCCIRMGGPSHTLSSHLQRIAGIKSTINIWLYLSLVTFLLLNSIVPCSLFLEAHAAGLYQPMGHMPILPSNHLCSLGMYCGLVRTHRNITFGIKLLFCVVRWAVPHPP